MVGQLVVSSKVMIQDPKWWQQGMVVAAEELVSV